MNAEPETIYTVAQTLLRPSDDGSGRAHKASPSIVDDIYPTKAPTRVGLTMMTVPQLLSVRIERATLNGTVSGYQRFRTDGAHVRKIAAALRDGRRVSPPLLGLDGGYLYAVDGHHRILAYVMAGQSASVLVEPMTYDEREVRFAAQRFQKAIGADNLVLASSDPLAEYVKDAIANPDNPFHSLVGMTNTTSKMGAASAYEIAARYSLNLIGQSAGVALKQPHHVLVKAKTKDLHELARLLTALGTKTTNPFAYRPAALRALADLAVLVVVRSDMPRGSQIERWSRAMPKFEWHHYAWATKTSEIRPLLLEHWNKRLAAERKASF